MSSLVFACVCCHAPAEDEYHWWEDSYDPPQEIVWMLCEKCCEFAVSIVESLLDLDNEEERAGWAQWK